MSADNARADVSTAGREIAVARLFDAPRELVWKMYTDPEHIVEWWGPRGFRTTIQEIDVRPGGHWRLVMHGPDGRDYRNHIVYVEVVPPERLVFKHVPETGTEPVRFLTTVTLEAVGNKTRVSLQMLFTSAAERDDVAKTYGAVEGLAQTMGRLKEKLSGMQSISSTEGVR